MLTRNLFFALAAVISVGGCKKEEECNGTKTASFNQTDFVRVTAGSAMHVTIQKGNTFSIEAEGCRRDIEDLNVRKVEGQSLEVSFKRSIKTRTAVYVNITMPIISALNLSGASEGQVNGFGGSTSNLRIVLSGASKARVQGTPYKTQFDLSGASKLFVEGATELLYGNISGASELQAFATNANEVDLSTSGGSMAYVVALHKLVAEASGGSKIIYKGNPATKDLVTSGGGQIIPD